MMLACVTSPERGKTDQVLDAVASRLTGQGARVAGALRPIVPGRTHGYCDSDLRLLPDGPVVRITQDLGAGSRACRMDAGAMERAVGLATARLEAEGADLFVLNKFGQREAEGGGFRALIAEALGRDIPVLIGVTQAHRAAFEQFSGDMAAVLPADEQALLDWCHGVVGHLVAPLKGA